MASRYDNLATYAQRLAIALLVSPLLQLPSSAQPKGWAAYKMARSVCIAMSRTDDEQEKIYLVSEDYQRAIRDGTSKEDLDWALGPKGRKLTDALLDNLISNSCKHNNDVPGIIFDQSYYPSVNAIRFSPPFKPNPDAFRVWLNTKTAWPGYRKVVFTDLSECRVITGLSDDKLYRCDKSYATFTSPLGSEICSLYDLEWRGPYLTFDEKTGQRTKLNKAPGASFTRLKCRWLNDSRFQK